MRFKHLPVAFLGFGLFPDKASAFRVQALTQGGALGLGLSDERMKFCRSG